MSKQQDRIVLAVNVGNSHTRLGLFSHDQLLRSWESTTPASVTCDEARAEARAVVRKALGEDSAPDGAILSCVVPSHVDAWVQALSRLSQTRPLVVGPGLRSGVRMRQDDPAGVGSDRVANVAAAHKLYGAPVVIVSLGTTTSIEVVDAQGAFAGGIIAPGLELGVNALGSAAARLPMVELRAPSSVIGKNTREAMQSGIVYGEVARIGGLIDMALDELGYEAPVVVTGDHASLMAALLGRDATVNEALTLQGLVHIWHQNRSR